MTVAGVGNALPSLAKIGNSGTGGMILDLVFRDCALLFSNTKLLISPKLGALGAPIPLPILGFSFDVPEEIGILKYEYTEYPLLNKQVVANSFLKEPVDISVSAIRPIRRNNPVALNYITNRTLIALIEKYCDNGGLWTLNTGWGIFSDLALTELSGTKTGDHAGADLGGVGFNFRLRKMHFDNTFATSKISSLLKKLTS